MVDEDLDSNLENRLSNPEPHLPNINVIWDLRRLLKSSQERLEGLKTKSFPDLESVQLERAIIKGVSEEIKRLKKEALCQDTFDH